MKHIIYTSVLFLSFMTAFSQAPFWNETFGSGCSQGTYANGLNPSGIGTWSVVSTGTNDPYSNKWFVSAMEAGMGIGNCGAGCGGANNRTLHIGWDINFIPFLDDGSIYSAGNGTSDTDIRAQSPTINCTGQNNISLSFAYLMGGIPGLDYMDVQYSANGGATWTVIATPPPTPTALCSPQGQWTGYTLTLPASANNNNNVKLGFRWQNIDTSGTDPSVAIDDVKLTSVIASFSVASPLCAGKTITVTAITNTAIVVSGYTWSATPAGPVFGAPNATATSIIFPLAGTFSITLATTSGTNTGNYLQTVLINPIPTLTANASPTIICAGQVSSLTVNGANTYTWNPGAIAGSNIVVSPTITSNYTVIASAAGCTASAVRNVSVNPSPNITLSASPVTICISSSSTLTANGAASYTWNPGALTGSNVVVSPTVSTTYTAVGLTGSCNSTKTLSVNVFTCGGTGINSSATNVNAYSIFPNPTSDKLFIQVKNNSSVDATIEIVDALGKTALKQNYNFNSSDNTRSLSVSTLPVGIYFVKITSLKDIIVLRFVKE